ncbi:MAG: PepSY-associated TM helix domain-containing protein [Rudaea sp.]|uniref:PepSY-associated TM helix domain-containing protein n=1 Tax=Rudaea sp. TaxID=2136325 RepID=UPI0039E3C0D3
MSSVNTHAAARRNRTYRLVRQLHLWIGAWGAIAAILFGFSGFIQNHRGVLKLPQGESTEISKTEFELPDAARASPEALRDWLRDVRHVPIDSVRAQPGGPGEGRGQPPPAQAAPGENGAAPRARPAARWMFSGGNARSTWSADYVPGSATIQVRNTEQSPLAVLSRLHKGVGGGVAWILLSDSFALAMVLLGISGIVMWARGRSAKQMVFSILGAGVLVLLLIGGAAVV